MLFTIAFIFITGIETLQNTIVQDTIKNEPKKVSIKAICTVGVSYHAGSESAFINFGGPGVKLELGKLGISYFMIPSLRYFHGNINDATNTYRTKTAVTPILGTGVQLSYKKISIIMPMYYLPNNNVWILSTGLGFKL